jgi:ubiquinone/menaquinone biosynthesis C-methylase UbiE
MSGQDFDERAATWDDDPAKVARARHAAEAIRRTVELQPTTRMLDYGAGTGLLAERLVDGVGSLVVADPSEGMRSVMEAKVAAGRLPDAEVVDLDLSRPETREGVGPFDLVTTMLALHHIPDLTGVLAGFAAVLAPGGQLAVIDLEAEDGSFHGPGFPGHEGFDRDELATALTAAGFTPPAFVELPPLEKHGRDYGLFLATCSRR